MRFAPMAWAMAGTLCAFALQTQAQAQGLLDPPVMSSPAPLAGTSDLTTGSIAGPKPGVVDNAIAADGVSVVNSVGQGTSVALVPAPDSADVEATAGAYAGSVTTLQDAIDTNPVLRQTLEAEGVALSQVVGAAAAPDGTVILYLR